MHDMPIHQLSIHEMYEYEILLGLGTIGSDAALSWRLESDTDTRFSPYRTLREALNKLGQEGWEVIAKGPFGTASPLAGETVAVEILLQRYRPTVGSLASEQGRRVLS